MEKKLIDYRLYDVRNTLFKTKANERSSFKKLYCSNSDNCAAFKNGQCAAYVMGAEKCPYASKTAESGYTKRAKGYASWIDNKKAEVKDIKQLSKPPSIFECGDYIYFKFPHWSMGFNKHDKYYTAAFGRNVSFIEKEDFTTELLARIITSRPVALFGGEITTYQSEVVPKILMALKTNMPEFVEKLINDYPHIGERINGINFVGMEIQANTLRPGSTYDFERYGIATWDGTTFVINDYGSAFQPIKGNSTFSVIPDKNTKLKVQSNDQVDENTVFI